MKKYQFLLFAGAAFAAPSAWAQDAAAPAPGEGDIVIADMRIPPAIVVVTGVPQYARDAGRAVTEVNRDEIERRQTVAIADLLATTPGVTVSRNGGPGGFTGLRIRGAEAEQTLVLIDGVRANDPSSPGGGFDFGNLLAGAVERVELLRGPNAVVWGSQALGGVVNIVTRRPGYGFTASGNAEYGSEDQASGNATLGYASDAFKGAVSAGYLRTDGISQAASGTEADGYRQFNASGRLSVDFAPGFGADAAAYYTDSRLDLDGYAPPTYAFGDTAEYSTTKEFYGYAGLRAEIGPVRNRLGFSLGDIDRDNFDPALGTTPSFFGRGRSERYEYRGDAEVIEQLRLVFGAEHEDTRYFDGFDRFDAGVTSVYGEAIAKPIEAVTFTAGVRNDDHKAYGSHTSFGANVAVRPIDGTVLQASYGEGFKSPTLYQLYSAYGTRSLAPETAQSYEIGIRQQIAQHRITLGVTWFHRDTHNQIDFQSCPAAQVTDPASICYQRPYGTYNNIARTRAQGFEFEIVAPVVTDLTFRANYTHVTAENRSAGANLGRELARRPRDAGSVSIDYRLPFGLSMGGTVTMVGHSFDDPGNAVRLHGHTLASIRAEMPLGEHFALYAKVENLFDAHYQTVATYGTPGRAAHAGVRLRFD